MARKKARFRISLKDNLTGNALKIELLEGMGNRFSIRQNGVRARRTLHGNISVVCARLRHWLVTQAKASRC